MVYAEVPVMYLLTTLLTTSVIALSTQDVHDNLIRHLDTVNTHLKTLTRTVRSAHSSVSQQRYEDCKLLGPSSDTLCALLELDSKLEDDRSTLGPDDLENVKRSMSDSQIGKNGKLLIEDLLRKERFLDKLLAVLSSAQSSVSEERKRSCNVNLGFHCQAEHYSNVADMYNWLQSSLSPGRRRRRRDVTRQATDKVHRSRVTVE